MARNKREKQLIENYNQQGITENYPQYATNFWGDANNNYGFGSSDISGNIENVISQLNNNGFNSVGDNQNVNMLQTANQQPPFQQIIGGAMDMVSEYFKMKNHGYKYLDDYHHCKANYNAAARGPYGYNTAKTLGDAKEQFDFYWNQAYKGMDENAAQKDRLHDQGVNANGRLLGDSGLYNNAQEACKDYRSKNPAFPKKYW